MAQISCTPGLKAFLDLVAWAEGTSTDPRTQNDGYDIIAANVAGLDTITDYACHPFQLGRPPILYQDGCDTLLTTNAGRYQISLPTWQDIAATHRLGSFRPHNQDHCALVLLVECRAYTAICNGQIDDAIHAASIIWSSFPGNLFQPGGKPLYELTANYQRFITQPTD